MNIEKDLFRKTLEETGEYDEYIKVQMLVNTGSSNHRFLHNRQGAAIIIIVSDKSHSSFKLQGRDGSPVKV